MIKKNRCITGFILFLFTLLISQINFPLVINSWIMPDYFLALFTALIATRFLNISIFTYFLLGLIVDVLVGQLIGQYGLVFVVIYFTSFILNKYFLFKSQIMQASQHIFLTTIGLIILLISSLSYELSLNIDLFFMKWVVTCLICLLFHKLIKHLNIKN